MTSPESVPRCAWTRRFDESVPRQGRPIGPTLSLLVEMLPTIFRLIRHTLRERKQGREVIFDPTRSIKASPEMGVPLGGLGGGTITRGWRGGFVRWQLRPGIYRYGVAPADQFSLWTRREAEPARAVVLSPRPENVPRRKPAGGRRARRPGPRAHADALEQALSGWDWGLDNRLATYYALYPRAWTTYTEPAPGLRLTCRQVSPVIPHDYRESSTPAGVFVWTVENTGSTEVETALMFSFQNGTGGENDLAGGHWNEALPWRPAGPGDVSGEGEGGPYVGVLLRHVHRQARPLLPGQRLKDRGCFEDPLTFAIAAHGGPGTDLSRRTRFSGGEASELWEDFADDGRLEEGPGRTTAVVDAPGQVDGPAGATTSVIGEAIGAAVAAGVRVPPGESRDLVFGLAWDMPLARFGSGTAWYRRYTRFYGRDGRAAETIIRDALRRYRSWEERIVAWQKPVLDDQELPDWYKSALFNETYYIADGGTIWTDGMAFPGDNAEPPEGAAPPAGERETSQDGLLPETDYGHFAYLEGHEYAMYNTYDVHFYASFALATLWPELQLSLQRDYARSVRIEHPEEVPLLFSGARAARKVRGAVPHDLGTPFGDPWRKINSYNAQDVSRWKDLGPKFVLQVYRDYVITRNRGFLTGVWRAVEESIAFVERFDRDGDGLIENDGFPDQTYDVWSAKGPSAYSGGLWVACLAAAAAMAGELGLAERAAHYGSRLSRARKAYEERLWNGRYYNYDASRSSHHDSVMADQLAGNWYARACGLEPVVPTDRACSALHQIFGLNVMGNEGGRRGAVNGMRPGGRVDRSCLQSGEIWTGTTYGLAAAMLQEGLIEEAFTTARGIYHTVWRDFGLWFQTPEAVSTGGIYRSLGYMRPLAVWAVQWAWERRGRIPVSKLATKPSKRMMPAK